MTFGLAACSDFLARPSFNAACLLRVQRRAPPISATGEWRNGSRSCVCGINRNQVALGQRPPGRQAWRYPPRSESQPRAVLHARCRHARASAPWSFSRAAAVSGGKLAHQRLDPQPALERRVGAPHGLGQDGLQRHRQGRAVVIGQPARQLDQAGRQRGRQDGVDRLEFLADRPLARGTATT